MSLKQDSLPCFAKILLNSASDVNAIEVCEEIKELCLSKYQSGLMTISIIQSWTKLEYKNELLNFLHNGVSATFSTSLTVQLVTGLGIEESFVQVLLLLPEELKEKLVLTLCCYLKSNYHESFGILCKAFIKEAFTHYAQNVIHNSVEMSRKSFYQNVLSIADLVNFIDVASACQYMCNMVDNVLLGKSETLTVGKYEGDVSNCSILNLFERNQVLQLHNSCRTVQRTGILLVSNTQNDDQLSDGYVNFLLKVIPIFKNCLNSLNDVAAIEPKFGETLLGVLVKLKNIMFEVKLKCPKYADEFCTSIDSFMAVCNKICGRNELIRYVCKSSSSDDIVNMIDAFKEADDELLFSFWLEEKDARKKLILSISRLNKIYCGHEVVFDWLLLCDQIKRVDKEAYVACLRSYIINFCSIQNIKKIIAMCCRRKKESEDNIQLECLEKVLLTVSETFSVKFCDNLLKVCRTKYSSDATFPWLCKSSVKQFYKDLNEVINKLTDDEMQNESSLKRLVQMCITSPLAALNEIFKRTFMGNLKSSVAVKFVCKVPSLLKFNFGDPMQPSVFLVIKETYLENQKENASFKILTDVLTVLLESFPNFHFEVATAVLDIFIEPNLHGDASCFLPDRASILELLRKCVKIIAPEDFIMDQVFILLKLILLDRDTKALENFTKEKSIHEVVMSLVNVIATNFDYMTLVEKDRILILIQELMKNLYWTEMLYFYKFFVSIGYLAKYRIPSILFEFCGFSNDYIWQAVDADEYDEEDICKWIALFQVGMISMEGVKVFVEAMTPIEIDDEMSNIIEAVSLMLGSKTNKFKAQRIISTLDLLTREVKLSDISSYVSEELQPASEYHSMCFSLLVFIQSFLSLYEDMVECEKFVLQDIQNYVTLLYTFVSYGKDITDTKVRCSYFLFFTEQLVHAGNHLSETLNTHLILLATEVRNAVTEYCEPYEEAKTKLQNILAIAKPFGCFSNKKR